MTISARRAFGALMTVGVLASVSACSSDKDDDKGDPVGGQVIAPVTMSVQDLPNQRVELRVGQALNINVPEEALEQFQGDVEHEDIVKFTPGRTDDTARFNPGVTALKEGESGVTLVNEADDAQFDFTVVVHGDH